MSSKSKFKAIALKVYGILKPFFKFVLFLIGISLAFFILEFIIDFISPITDGFKEVWNNLKATAAFQFLKEVFLYALFAVFILFSFLITGFFTAGVLLIPYTIIRSIADRVYTPLKTVNAEGNEKLFFIVTLIEVGCLLIATIISYSLYVYPVLFSK